MFMMGQGAFHLLFAYKGSEYFDYDNLQPVATQIAQDTRPTFVDALLRYNFQMGQRVYHNLHCL
jgi:hypothetical protein